MNTFKRLEIAAFAQMVEATGDSDDFRRKLVKVLDECVALGIDVRAQLAKVGGLTPVEMLLLMAEVSLFQHPPGDPVLDVVEALADAVDQGLADEEDWP